MNLRRASEAPVPYKSALVTLMLVKPTGEITQSHHVGEKREMLREPGRLLAAWTGRYHTDIFEVDDIEAVRQQLNAPNYQGAD